MNYQTWSQRKFWLVLAGVLFLGTVISPKGTTSEVADSNVQVLSAEAVKEVRAETQDQIKQLDAIDQEIFSLAADVVDAHAESLDVAGTVLQNLETITIAEIDGATETVLRNRTKVQEATEKVGQLRDERDELLGK